MSDNLDQVIKKLQDETNKNLEDPFITMVGEFLMDSVQKHPEIASFILIDKKTIQGAFNEMRDRAHKQSIEKKHKGYGMFSLPDGLKIVLEYYEIPAAIQDLTINEFLTEGYRRMSGGANPVPAPAAFQPAPASGAKSGIDLSLEDLF